ncbi:hypothetical protein EDC94DRAFT_406093 [Helicostylum pulchrum]|nr:hypothetical protein EDC94DRAFT_406093 [Helicostylum pulchrum]
MAVKFNTFTRLFAEDNKETVIWFKLLAHIVETHLINPGVFVVSELRSFSEMGLYLFFCTCSSVPVLPYLFFRTCSSVLVLLVTYIYPLVL